MANSTQMVRNFAAAKGIVRKKEAKAALDMTQNQIVYAFETLKAQGYLDRVGHGKYQFVEKVEKPGAEVTDKIWRAMKIKKVFTAAQIAMLSGSTVNYIYKLFRGFRADGVIKQHGLKPRSSEKVWRLTLKGKNKAIELNMKEFKPDPLVMAAVNLNRLICSGVAARDHKAGEQALELCGEIRKGLEDAATS